MESDIPEIMKQALLAGPAPTKAANFYHEKLPTRSKTPPHVKVCRTCKSHGHLAGNCRARFPYCRYCLGHHATTTCPSVKVSSLLIKRTEKPGPNIAYLELDDSKMLDEFGAFLKSGAGKNGTAFPAPGDQVMDVEGKFTGVTEIRVVSDVIKPVTMPESILAIHDNPFSPPSEKKNSKKAKKIEKKEKKKHRDRPKHFRWASQATRVARGSHPGTRRPATTLSFERKR